MQNFELLPSQKKQVIEILKSEGFDITLFSWEIMLSEKCARNISKLSYNDGKFYFLFDFHRNDHYCEFSPGEEKELLIAAAKSVELYIISIDQIGKIVRVGDEYFKDDSDPAYAAKYFEAFESLLKCGNIVHESGS